MPIAASEASGRANRKDLIDGTSQPRAKREAGNLPPIEPSLRSQGDSEPKRDERSELRCAGRPAEAPTPQSD